MSELKAEFSWAEALPVEGKSGNGSFGGQHPQAKKLSLMAWTTYEIPGGWTDPPHFTIDLRAGYNSYQHVDIRKPAYVFDGAWNKDAGRHIQVYVVGVAKSTGWWTAERLDELAKYLYDICTAAGIPQACPFDFSATADEPNKARKGENQYGPASGIMGIEHAPDNPGRWGPGRLNTELLQASVHKYATIAVEERANSPESSKSGDASTEQAGREEAGEDLIDHDMSDKPFRFNPPLHKHAMPPRSDFSSNDPAGFENATYRDESTFVFGSKDATPLQQLRLGRIIQHEMAAGMAAVNEQRYGFRFLYNPTQFSTSATRNDSVVIDPQSVIGAVLSGINQNFQTISFKVFLNRIADIMGPPLKAHHYPQEIYFDDVKGIKTYGTHWDLEILYRLCNGIFKMEDRGKSGDIGVIIPSNARLILGPGQNHFGFVESVSWTDQMFSEDMIPMVTEADIVFRRHVDMQPEQTKAFWDSLTTSGVTGEQSSGESEGGGSPGAGTGETDTAGGAVDTPGVTSSGGSDPMALWKKNGLNAAWTYGQRDPVSKVSKGAKHRAWDIQASLGTPLLAGVYGVVDALNDGVPDNKGHYNPGSGAPSNWVRIHTNYSGGAATVYYQHLNQNSIAVSVGTKVTPTTYIARTGNSGNSTGPHLHLATMKGKQKSNYKYLDDESVVLWPPSLLFANQK